MEGLEKETVMKFLMKKLLAAALILGLAAGSYALLGSNDAEAMPPGPRCKKCKDRPWCGCTLNGAPRISCDPCCYDTQPFPTCLD